MEAKSAEWRAYVYGPLATYRKNEIAADVAAEREACAKLVEMEWTPKSSYEHGYCDARKTAAYAIRTRGE